MQIQTGHAAVTHANSTVVASAGNDWSAATAGSLFGVPGDGVFYSIAATTPPGLSGSGKWELTLTANYAGATAAAATYCIAVDFTPNLGLPLITPGDSATAALFSRAMGLLDAVLARFPAPLVAGKWLHVNAGGTAFEFVDAPTVGGAPADSTFDFVTANALPPSTANGNWYFEIDFGSGVPRGFKGDTLISLRAEVIDAAVGTRIAGSTAVQEITPKQGLVADPLGGAQLCCKAAVVAYIPAMPQDGYGVATNIRLAGQVRGRGWSAPGADLTAGVGLSMVHIA